MVIAIYIAILTFIGILFLFSLDEKIPEGNRDSPVLNLFEKIASYLYRRFLKDNRVFLSAVRIKRIKEKLVSLDHVKDPEKQLKDFYIGKISVSLLIITLGCGLCIVSWYSAGKDKYLTENGEIVREGYGGGDRNQELQALDENGEDLGTYSVNVGEKEYSKEEAEKLYLEIAETLVGKVKGENENLSHVTEKLDLISEIEDYPFAITWDIEDTDIIGTDGKITDEDLPEDGKPVMLTAVFRYGQNRWEQNLTVRVFNKERSFSERLIREITKELNESEEEDRTKDTFMLPTDAEGVTLFWKEKHSDDSIILLLLIFVAAGAVYVAGDKELDRKAEARKKEMILEYPQFVSRLVLYMSAGMSVRGILMKFAGEYKADIEAGKKRSFLYEEIVRSCRELESGLPELSVYERLGLRCGVQQYTRLVTLLSQNLRKGNNELLMLLKEEADKATLSRMSFARKLGEEAGTKLLIPMVMLLAIVMIVIMVPAYLSF